MVEEGKSSPRSFVIALLVVFTPVTYWGSIQLLSGLVNLYIYDNIPIGLFFLAVLVFDVVWVIIVKRYLSDNIKVIVLTWLFLTLSASMLTCLWLARIFDRMA